MPQLNDPAREVLARANRVARLLAECQRQGVALSPELTTSVTETLTALERVRCRLADHLTLAPIGIKGNLRRWLRYLDTARQRINTLRQAP